MASDQPPPSEKPNNSGKKSPTPSDKTNSRNTPAASVEESSSVVNTLRDVYHRAVAGLLFAVITVFAAISWPLDLLYSMPWNRVERSRRPRATRENLADPASTYYRIGEPQVYYLANVHIIPEAQKQALAHLEPNKKALGYREVLEVMTQYSAKEGKMLKQYRLSDYKWLTLAQVDERITTLEKAFRELGVEHGQRVLIYAETRIGT